MIRRLLVLVLLALTAAWWWRRVVAGSRRRPLGSRAGGDPAREIGPMVRDRICNTFLPASRALSLRAGGEEHHFCSEACRAKFLEQAKTRSA